MVRANPPANIDWLKESLIISTGNHEDQSKLHLADNSSVLYHKNYVQCTVKFLIHIFISKRTKRKDYSDNN